MKALFLAAVEKTLVGSKPDARISFKCTYSISLSACIIILIFNLSPGFKSVFGVSTVKAGPVTAVCCRYICFSIVKGLCAGVILFTTYLTNRSGSVIVTGFLFLIIGTLNLIRIKKAEELLKK